MSAVAAARIADLLSEARRRLNGAVADPGLESELLLGHRLGVDRGRLRAFPEREIEPAVAEAYRADVQRLAAGTPLAHVLGEQEFWSLRLRVTPETLIPRPETECLVEQALAAGNEEPLRVADLGTGSGAVALALASERPAWDILAADASEAALEVARGNARRLGLENVRFAAGDLCEALDGAFDMIVSNPPYVADDDPHFAGLKAEPRPALAGGPDGLSVIRRLAACARGHLLPGGSLLIEHGWDQGPAVRALLEKLGYARVRTVRDYGGRDRVALCRWPGVDG